ncbi:DUF2336 domain-containing protein [Methylobacterium nigriterrae]|uniref:DUF2336 domain-containing protein n=1 Tax=Methylobacterium nigriterrae TaxID=3127512 RepID=UPI0030138301
MPALRQSILLQDADLITIAQTRSQGHLGAMADRREVGASVTDVIGARGNWPALRLLAANRTAELSGQGLARLAALSRGDGHITVALTKRTDLPAAVKGGLLARFRDMVMAQRSVLRGEHSDVQLDQVPPGDMSVPAASAPARQGGTDPLSAEKLRSAAVRVGVLSQSRPLTCTEVSDALARGRLTEAVVILARLSDEEPETFVHALRGLSPVKNLALR